MRTRLIRPPLLHLVAAGVLLVIAIVGACSEGAPNAPGTRPIVSEAQRGAPQATISEGPYFEFQVERTVRQIPGTGNLRYPTAMRLANREGEVLAQFVVDARGIVDLRSFKALKSSDKAFTDAVVTALPEMRFTPALVGGKAVAQVVQQPFTFALQSNRLRVAHRI